MSIFDQLDRSVRLTESETLLVDAVARLAREKFAPRAQHYDQTGEFPRANVEAINELGLNMMFIPDAYGGARTSFVAYLLCVRELSKACASTGIIWATNCHAITPLVDFGTEPQKRRLLPVMASGGLASLCITEPSAGSSALDMKTRFVPDGNDIVIDGQKIFITNGDVADLYVLFGKWSKIDDSKRSISALIVERGTPGLTVVHKEDKMGHRASSTVTLAFDACRVPRGNLLCEPGDGLRILLASLNKSRPSIAAHALGIARAAFESAVAYVNDREQSGRRIIEFQGIQFLLADLAAELAQCEAWLWYVARMIDDGATDFGIEASILKMRASDLAMRVATEAVQMYGGYGYCKGNEAERLMRDAKITQIWEGTNQIHRQLIGRSFING